MSREKRRAGGSGRSRRTAVRPAGTSGRQLPLVPIIAVVGVAAVVGLVAYLIWQIGQPTSSGLDDDARVEGDLAPDKPGEHIDLQGIYDGFYGNPDGNTTAAHVTRTVDYSEQGLPPAGGPHWGSGSCPTDPADAPPFCGPAPWGIYRDAWDAETLIHNMEHGGMVIWYDTSDQTVIDELEDLVRDNSEKNLVLTPFPDMDDEHVAITIWARRDLMPVGEYSRERLEDFMDAWYCEFDPENFC